MAIEQKTPAEETQPDRVEALEKAVGTIADLIESLVKEIDGLKKSTVKKSTGLFGGKRTKTAIKDTKTGKIYPSKANMGKQVAAEFDLDPGNNFVYYQIILKAPDRFVEASDEEAEKVWKEEEAKRAKEVEEENKRLEAERQAEAAKVEAAKATKK